MDQSIYAFKSLPMQTSNDLLSQETPADQTNAPDRTKDATEQPLQPKPIKPFANRPSWAEEFNKLLQREEKEDLSLVDWSQEERLSEERKLQKARAKESQQAKAAHVKDPKSMTTVAPKKATPIILLEDSDEGKEQTGKTQPPPETQKPKGDSQVQKYIENLQRTIRLDNNASVPLSKDQVDQFLSKYSVQRLREVFGDGVWKVTREAHGLLDTPETDEEMGPKYVYTYKEACAFLDSGKTGTRAQQKALNKALGIKSTSDWEKEEANKATSKGNAATKGKAPATKAKAGKSKAKAKPPTTEEPADSKELPAATKAAANQTTSTSSRGRGRPKIRGAASVARAKATKEDRANTAAAARSAARAKSANREQENGSDAESDDREDVNQQPKDKENLNDISSGEAERAEAMQQIARFEAKRAARNAAKDDLESSEDDIPPAPKNKKRKAESEEEGSKDDNEADDEESDIPEELWNEGEDDASNPSARSSSPTTRKRPGQELSILKPRAPSPARFPTSVKRRKEPSEDEASHSSDNSNGLPSDPARAAQFRAKYPGFAKHLDKSHAVKRARRHGPGHPDIIDLTQPIPRPKTPTQEQNVFQSNVSLREQVRYLKQQKQEWQEWAEKTTTIDPGQGHAPDYWNGMLAAYQAELASLRAILTQVSSILDTHLVVNDGKWTEQYAIYVSKLSLAQNEVFSAALGKYQQRIVQLTKEWFDLEADINKPQPDRSNEAVLRSQKTALLAQLDHELAINTSLRDALRKRLTDVNGDGVDAATLISKAQSEVNELKQKLEDASREVVNTDGNHSDAARRATKFAIAKERQQQNNAQAQKFLNKVLNHFAQNFSTAAQKAFVNLINLEFRTNPTGPVASLIEPTENERKAQELFAFLVKAIDEHNTLEDFEQSFDSLPIIAALFELVANAVSHEELKEAVAGFRGIARRFQSLIETTTREFTENNPQGSTMAVTRPTVTPKKTDKPKPRDDSKGPPSKRQKRSVSDDDQPVSSPETAKTQAKVGLEWSNDMPNRGVGTKIGVKAKGGAPGANLEAYEQWALYTAWCNMQKDDNGVFNLPPPFVRLDDANVGRLQKFLTTGHISAATLQSRWPADFDRSGLPTAKRPNRGNAYKRPVEGTLYYGTIANVYTLHGDEKKGSGFVAEKDSSGKTIISENLAKKYLGTDAYISYNVKAEVQKPMQPSLLDYNKCVGLPLDKVSDALRPALEAFREANEADETQNAEAIEEKMMTTGPDSNAKGVEVTDATPIPVNPVAGSGVPELDSYSRPMSPSFIPSDTAEMLGKLGFLSQREIAMASAIRFYETLTLPALRRPDISSSKIIRNHNKAIEESKKTKRPDDEEE